MMELDDIPGGIVDAALRIHVELGPGLLESVYEAVLARALERRGFRVERQKAIRFEYDGMVFEEGFRMDLLVEGRVVVELKSVEKLAPVHGKQVLTYLRLSQLPVGLLINFGAATLKEGLHRIVNQLPNSAPPREPTPNRRQAMSFPRYPNPACRFAFSLAESAMRVQVFVNNTRPASPRCAPGGLLLCSGRCTNPPLYRRHAESRRRNPDFRRRNAFPQARNRPLRRSFFPHACLSPVFWRKPPGARSMGPGFLRLPHGCSPNAVKIA